MNYISANRYIVGLLLMDMVMVSAILFAPFLIIMWIVYPILIMNLIGGILMLADKEPRVERWNKPSWWFLYDIGSDIAILYACFYTMNYALLFLYAFSVPLKYLRK